MSEPKGGAGVTVVANRTPLTIPLLDGEVTVDGVDLQVMQSKSIDDTSRRMLDVEFDFGEMSIGTFIRGRDRGVALAALPLFTNSRQFLNANTHVAARAGLRTSPSCGAARSARPNTGRPHPCGSDSSCTISMGWKPRT